MTQKAARLYGLDDQDERTFKEFMGKTADKL